MKKMLKRGIAGILSAIMGVTTPVFVAFADNEVSEPTEAKISAYVSTSGYATDDAAFMLMCDELSVLSNEAESFGFSDTVKDGVSVIDAMVKLNEEMYGADFNLETAGDYIAISNGFFSNMFGLGAGFSYAHNTKNLYTPYTKIENGDKLEIFFYADTENYMDVYVPHNDIKAIKGEKTVLNAQGTMFGWETPYAGVEDIQLAYIKSNVPVLVDEKAFTDEDGNITVTFDKVGTYTLSFMGETVQGLPVILSPFTVEVIDPYDKTATQLETSFVFGEEWNILGLARGGYAISDADKEKYYNSVTDAYQNGKMTGANDYDRVVIALSALGLEVPQEFIEVLSSYDTSKGSYVSQAMYALIAMDAKSLDFADIGDASDQNTRQRLIDYIISSQLEGGGYGYSWGGATYADIDTTAIAIQALAKYRNDEKVQAMIDGCIALIEKTDITGVEANAQVVIAYNTLGLDSSKYFEKMLSYYDSENGFTSQWNATITRQQALYALASHKRAIHNDTALYDMSDTADTVSIKSHNDGGYSVSAPKNDTVTAISVKYNENGTLDKVYFNNAFDLKMGSLNYFKPEFDGGKVMLWESNQKPVVFNIK
ncbi:MAG: hypothetical protein IJT23_00310 [Clostridia bacterium]|nr:hypothetical protein [Clostridia bacterium]